MAEEYGFFDAVVTNGAPDRIYSADDVNNIFKGLLSDGVFRMYENALRVSAGSGLSVDVDTGKAIVRDHWYLNTTIKNLTLLPAHATQDRYSSVVLRYDRGARSVTLAVIDGEPASNPAVPELTRNNDVYEIRLVNVYVAAGSAYLSDANITDARQYTGGIVDVPEVAYRRYTYTVASASGERYIDIPQEYSLTPNTILEVYAAGALCQRDQYSLQINETEGNYMIAFKEQKAKGTVLDFTMIN